MYHIDHQVSAVLELGFEAMMHGDPLERMLEDEHRRWEVPNSQKFWEMSFYINSVHNKGGVVCIPVSETPPSIVHKPLIIYRGREKRARMCTTL